jgi:hypothetical protein
MTSARVLDRPAVSFLASAHMPLASIAARWIFANVLPQAVLVAAAAVYLNANGISFAGLVTKEALGKLGNGGWPLLAVAVVYLATIVWMRGAVLHPLVPRFSILGWVPAAFLSGVAMLVAVAGGGLVGVLIAKGIALTGNHASPAPSGWALGPFVLGQIIGAEIVGLIVGGLPGLILGAAEALAVCRGTRRIAAWILWSAAAWSTAATIIMLHVLLIIAYPALPAVALTALAAATPILMGVAAALLTLPAIAKLARQRGGTA